MILKVISFQNGFVCIKQTKYVTKNDWRFFNLSLKTLIYLKTFCAVFPKKMGPFDNMGYRTRTIILCIGYSSIQTVTSYTCLYWIEYITNNLSLHLIYIDVSPYLNHIKFWKLSLQIFGCCAVSQFYTNTWIINFKLKIPSISPHKAADSNFCASAKEKNL